MKGVSRYEGCSDPDVCGRSEDEDAALSPRQYVRRHSLTSAADPSAPSPAWPVSIKPQTGHHHLATMDPAQEDILNYLLKTPSRNKAAPKLRTNRMKGV
ncbi:unnamed protein product [Lota lota]